MVIVIKGETSSVEVCLWIDHSSLGTSVLEFAARANLSFGCSSQGQLASVRCDLAGLKQYFTLDPGFWEIQVGVGAGDAVGPAQDVRHQPAGGAAECNYATWANATGYGLISCRYRILQYAPLSI